MVELSAGVLVLVFIVMALIVELAYVWGKRDGVALNVKLIVKLKAQSKQYKADALAFGTVKGLWATDMPHIIKHHARKECFFRLGFPEHKL
ncbi:MAG: hypothetical protein V3T88_00145 [Nitrosomonadaceae bacterium]